MLAFGSGPTAPGRDVPHGSVDARVRAVVRHRLGRSHGDAARQLLARLAHLELTPVVLARAVEPFPPPVRTLGALHLASIEFLRARRQDVRLATYDERLERAARLMRIPLRPLEA